MSRLITNFSNFPRRGGGGGICDEQALGSYDLYSWGYNNGSSGVLGLNTNTSNITQPQQVTGSTWSQVSTAGRTHSIALKSDGAVYVCGSNGQGQFGNGTTSGSSKVFIQTASSYTCKYVYAGPYQSVIIDEDGYMYGCGRQANGASLGLNSTSQQLNWTQEYLGETWKKVALSSGGPYSGAAINSDGSLYTSGAGAYGMLGNGSSSDVLIFQQIDSDSWADISIGVGHMIAVKCDGSLWGWGLNNRYQLGQGQGDTTNRLYPTQIGSASNWIKVFCSYFATHALNADGEIWSCGRNTNGVCGTNDSAGSDLYDLKQEYTQSTDWIDIGGGNYHVIAVKSNGDIWGWGKNDYTSLTSSAPVGDNLAPQEINTSLNCVGVSRGGSFDSYGNFALVD